MKLVSSAAEVYDALQMSKRSARAFVTNLFPEPTKLQAWIARRELFLVSNGRVAQLLRKDGDFFHLFFAASDPDALVEALSLRAEEARGTVVTDLIGWPAIVDELGGKFDAAGFRRYRSLQRLAKRQAIAESFSADPAVREADEDDVTQIVATLNASLDRYAEQIPPREEIAAAAQRKNVLVFRQGSLLRGFLYFELAGQTAVVRYWFVSQMCRGQGVGGKLMRTFFSRCPQARRVVLWVIDTNQDAIAKYSHYGFRPDGLVDRVMIKEWAA